MLTPLFVHISGNHINATFTVDDQPVRFYARICETEDSSGRPVLEARVDAISRDSSGMSDADWFAFERTYHDEFEEALIQAWRDHGKALWFMGEEKV